MAQRKSLTFNGTTWFYGLAPNAFPVITAGTTVVGKAGANNALWGAGNDVLVGGGLGGDNFFVLGRGDQAVIGAGDGIDTITRYVGDVTLPTGFANGTLSHAGTITGNAGQNILTVTGTGAHTLRAGSGSDVLVGSATGVDRFVITKGNGADVIMGFRPGIDTVQLAGFTNQASFAQVLQATTQVGPDAVVDLGGGQTLTFAGTSRTQLTAHDFDLPVNLASFQKTFDDEFTNFSASADGRGTTWRTFTGTRPANKEAEFYDNNPGAGGPFSLAGGVLDITATPVSTGLGLPYTSGEISTQRSFAQTYGYFEMRAQLPSGAGLWPAFWLLPADGSWPPELDTMEMLGNNPGTIYTSTRSQANGSHTIGNQVADTSKGFHTYGVDWEPDRVTYYFDGAAISSLATPADMNKPMYMIVNLGVGGVGSWPGPASGETGHMLVDYVRAYASPTAVQPPLTLVGWGETINKGDGTFSITGTGGGGWIALGNGNQTVQLTGAAGTVQGSSNTIITGDGNQSISVQGNANTITTGAGTSVIDAGVSYAHVTVGATPSGVTTIKASGFQDVITATGNGNIAVSGTAGSATVMLRDGDSTVTLGGSGNTVTTGNGHSVIDAGTGQDRVHTGSGGSTITVHGYTNLLDAGAGMNFLNGGTGSDTFVLNGAGQGVDAISGFRTVNLDVLDFTRALAGLPVAADLSNIGSFVTTEVHGGSTTILAGVGGSAQAIAVLTGVATSLPELVAHHSIRG